MIPRVIERYENIRHNHLSKLEQSRGIPRATRRYIHVICRYVRTGLALHPEPEYYSVNRRTAVQNFCLKVCTKKC